MFFFFVRLSLIIIQIPRSAESVQIVEFVRITESFILCVMVYSNMNVAIQLSQMITLEFGSPRFQIKWAPTTSMPISLM